METKGRRGSGIGKGGTHWNNSNTVESLLTNTLVSGQFYLQPPLQNPVSRQSPWAAADTFGVYELDFSFFVF